MQLVWDRGTLVLRGERDAAHVQELPGVQWDERTGEHRSPAWRYRELRAALPDLADQVLGLLPNPPAIPSPELRPYQAAAVAAWRAAGGRGTIVLPTGAGKTRTAIAAIATMGKPTLVLVPTRVLLEQWIRSLEDAGYPAHSIGRHGDGGRDEGPITIATNASARIHMESLGNRYELLVVDECHHFGSAGLAEVLEMCAAPLRLGLSATPPVDEERFGHISRLLGEVVFRSRIDDLSGAWLAEYRLVTLRLSLTPAERAEHDAAVAAFRPVCRDFFAACPTAAWPQFVAAAMRTEIGRRALAALRRTRELTSFAQAKQQVLGELLRRHARQRVLVFTADNEAAYAVARQHLVMPMTCDIPRAERSAVLVAFGRGELGALVSARVLNEGIDVPSAEVAILVGGAHGGREYVQRIGRVLRPAPDKKALIYELIMAGTHETRQAARRRERLATV